MIHKFSDPNAENALNNWICPKSECKLIFQEFSKFQRKQFHVEAKSLCKHLSWLNHKIYKGQTNLQSDKVTIENGLHVLEDKIWKCDFAKFEEKWLLKEGKATKEFLHLEDLKRPCKLRFINF